MRDDIHEVSLHQNSIKFTKNEVIFLKFYQVLSNAED